MIESRLQTTTRVSCEPDPGLSKSKPMPYPVTQAVVPATGKLRQENYKFKSCLGYRVGARASLGNSVGPIPKLKSKTGLGEGGNYVIQFLHSIDYTLGLPQIHILSFTGSSHFIVKHISISYISRTEEC